MRILVVEDEDRARHSLAKLIHAIDEKYYVVGEAGNGKEALEEIHALRPHAVITDICMPVMDGLELIRCAVKNNLRPHFAVVSAHADFEYAKQAMSLGVSHYLLKPIIYDELEQVLSALSLLPLEIRYSSERCDIHHLIRKVLSEIQYNYGRRIQLDVLAANLSVTPEYTCN